MTLAALSTFFIILSAICVCYGWWLIRKGKTKRHMKAMVMAAVLALTFFILYMSRTIFIGNTAFGGPEEMSTFYHSFLIFHIFLATVGAVLGFISLYTGFKQKFAFHKKLGPVTSIVWLSTALTGIAVFLFLYVIYPPGETTNVFRAIIGS